MELAAGAGPRYGGNYVAASTNKQRRRKATQTIQGQTGRLLTYELTLPLEIDRGPLEYTLTRHYIILQRTPTDTAAPLPTGG